MTNTSTATKRKLAPDLARGFMLLFIALAHAHLFLFSIERDITVMDKITVLFRQIFVDGRAFPLFAILYGYGLYTLFMSQKRKGHSWSVTKKVFRKRGAWMLFIGLIHVALFYDDIIGVYGLITFLFASIFVQLPNKKLIVLTVISLVVVWIAGAFMPRGFDTFHLELMNKASINNSIEASITRIVEWMIYTPLLIHQVIPGVLIGIWIARQRILDYRETYMNKLKNTAFIGIILSTIGAIPMATLTSNVWVTHVEAVELIAKSLHTITGYAGGIGWTALIMLVSFNFDKNRPLIITAIAAVGQRSMSFYLFQSIMFVLIFAPYAGGLGKYIGQTGSDLIAIFIWMLSVLMASLMQQKGIKGPAETFLRKCSSIK